MVFVVLLLFLYLGLGVDKRRKDGFRLDMALYLDGNSFIPVAPFTFPLLFLPSLLGRNLTPHTASPPQVDHKLLYLLRRTDDLPTGLPLMHLPDHNLELDDPTLIDLAEEINPGRMISFEGGNSGSVFDLHDVVIGEEVVAGERAVNEVHPIGDANAR